MGYGAAVTAVKRGVPTWGMETREPTPARLRGGGRPRVTESVDEIGAACDVVVLLVVNAAQTEEVLFGKGGGLTPRAAPGSVWSPRPPSTRDATGVGSGGSSNAASRLIDGPVSGGAKKAADAG